LNNIIKRVYLRLYTANKSSKGSKVNRCPIKSLENNV
jgi:hypothetical protein